MKHTLRTLLAIMACISICSCNQSPPENYLVMEIDLFNPQGQLPLSSFAHSPQSYRLELPSPHFFGIINEVLATDSLLFLVDKKQNKIFSFTNDGRFLYTVGQRGEGPQEFRNVTSFFIGEDRVYICDMGSRKILSYALDGSFIQTITFPHSLVFDHIAALPDGQFLCHRLGQDESCRGLWVMNDQGERIQTVLTPSGDYPYIHSDWNSLYTGKKGYIEIYDPPTGSYYAWDIEKGTLQQTMQLKTNTKMLADFKGVDNAMNIKEEYAYSQFSINGDSQVFSIWLLPSQGSIACSIYSKKEKQANVFTQPKMDYPGYKQMGSPLSSNIPNTLVTIITDEAPLTSFPEQYQHTEVNERVAILSFIQLK